MTISRPDWRDSRPELAHGGRGRLLQVLGVGFGVAVTIGNTIGAGIFRAPGEVAAHLPDTSLFLAAWTVGGVYALLGALQIAELGTMLPRSGGQYVFSRHALGDYAGFVVGWSDWLSTCGSAAAVAIVVGELAGALVPALAGHGTALAVGVASLFAMLQWRGIRRGSLIQHVTSSLKAAVFLTLIVAALASGAEASMPAAVMAPPAGLALATAFVLSLQAVIYTYDGWTGVGLLHGRSRGPGAGDSAIALRRRAGHHRHLPARERVVAARAADLADRGRGVRRGDRRLCDRRPTGRIAAAAPHARVDAERDQRLPPDGEPRALRDEPRRAVLAPRRHGQRRRHPHRRADAQCRGRHPVHRLRTHVRAGDHGAGVLLHRQLHAVVRVPVPAAPPRAGAAPPLSRVGLPLDDGSGTRGVGGVPCRCHRRRHCATACSRWCCSLPVIRSFE